MTTFLLGKNHFPCSWQLHAVCLQADIIAAMGVPIAYEDWTVVSTVAVDNSECRLNVD